MERRKAQRKLILNDVFYLLVRVCGRKDMIHPWIYDRCREVQRDPNEHLDLWARDHYKSTIITFGMTIQDVLADPNTTVLIMSHTKSLAQKFLKQIMTELENNKILKSLFPHVLWQNERERGKKIKWSEDDGIVLKRSTNPMVPTIMASGLVDGMPTGTHFSLLLYDDVVVPASVTTPEQRQKTTEMFDLSDNLGSQGITRKRFVGTRYHLFDTIANIISRNMFKVRIRAATSDGTDDPSKSVLLPPDVLAKKKISQGTNFNAQMLLDPKKDSTAGFKIEQIIYWPAVKYNNLNKAIFVDSSSGKHRELNKGDFTSMWCVGKGADEKKRIIDMVRDRLELPGKIEALFQLVYEYKVRLVFYEETGAEADIQMIKVEMKRRNYEFTLVPLKVKKVSKKSRILRLQAPFTAGDILFPQRILRLNHEGVMVNLMQQFIEEEFVSYPQVSHDDALDCLSQMEHEDVIKMWTPPNPMEIANPIMTRARQMKRAYKREAGWMAG